MSELIGEHADSLQALDQNEFYDVWRRMNPTGTRDEFEDAWEQFQDAKAEHDRHMRLN